MINPPPYAPSHTPVLLDFILNNLSSYPSNWILDATLGEGGHSEAFLKLGKKVVAFERDEIILKKALQRLAPCFSYSYINNTQVVNNFFPLLANFSQAHLLNPLKNLAPFLPNQSLAFPEIVNFNLILLDLGISKFHYQQDQRGFSFLQNQPLDMRLDPAAPTSAKQIINSFSQTQLASLFKSYGEEIHANRFAAAIIKNRTPNPINSTKELASIIQNASHKKYFSKLHPATKIFQALRIFINQELTTLQSSLPNFTRLLSSKNSRLAVIAYHSLEDRIVKNFFNNLIQKNENYNKYRCSPPAPEFSLLQRKPFSPSPQEISQNPAARSARLRILVKN